MRIDGKRMMLVLCAGALPALGCVIPQGQQAPAASPGSAASIGNKSGGAAPATAVAGIKDCGPNGLIDDGEDGNNQNLPNDNRGGYWYTFKDKGVTTVDPPAGEEGGTFAMSEGGHDSQYAARYHGTIGTGAIVFSGLGVNFIDPKGQYDASKYAGIMFWGKKGPDSVAKVRLKVPDVNTDPDGAVCTECFNDFGADMTFTNDWKLYVFPWKALKQLPDWGAPHKTHVTPSKLYGIQFQVNVPKANYDIYIDDLKFFCQ